MKNTLTIAWKETKTYFVSPMAYIIMAVYTALAAYYFVTSVSGVLPEGHHTRVHSAQHVHLHPPVTHHNHEALGGGAEAGDAGASHDLPGA